MIKRRTKYTELEGEGKYDSDNTRWIEDRMPIIERKENECDSDLKYTEAWLFPANDSFFFTLDTRYRQPFLSKKTLLASVLLQYDILILA